LMRCASRAAIGIAALAAALTMIHGILS